MFWLVLAIASSAFLGLYDVAKKSALDGNAVLRVLFACSASGAALLMPAGVLSWTAPAVARDLGVFVEPLPGAAHGLVFAKAAIVSLSWVLTYFAIKHLPISIAAPIRATAPLFVLLGALVLFGERLTPAQFAGVCAILAAYFAFSVIGRVEGIRFERNLWVWLLVAGTLVGAVSGLYDKHLMQGARLPPMAVQFWFTLYGAALQGAIVLAARALGREGATPFAWRWSILAVAGLLLLADNLYFRSLAIPGALVSVVSAVRRSNVIVSFAIGGLAFRERNRRLKAFALAGVLAGVFLLVK